ncbi:MAG: hypothetical protein Q8J89_02560 [Caulobacter sp.]|nr:hypothetical protein [Caulobacter sp.]
MEGQADDDFLREIPFRVETSAIDVMRQLNRLSASAKHRLFGGAFLRLLLGLVSATVLLAAPLCMAQAQSAECDAMIMTPMAGDDHQGQGARAPQLDCAVGCRLAPQVGPQVTEPVRIAYEVFFERERHTLDGIEVDPAVPPPRWAV